MDVFVRESTLGRHRDEALVLFQLADQPIRKQVGSAGAAFRAGYDTLLRRKAFSGGAGEVRVLTGKRDERLPTLVLVGLGRQGDQTRNRVRDAAASGARAARDNGAKSVTFVLPEGRGPALKTARAAEAIADGAVTGLYRFEPYKSEKQKGAIEALTILAAAGEGKRVQRAADEGAILGEAVCVARSLGNEPGNTATPTYLAEQAQALGDAHGFDVRIMEEEEMRGLGMGSLLGVSQGSVEPAKLIIMTYEPKGARGGDTVAIVGKGLTFDTGGISIKPGAKMEDMKFDMCGGAAVIGTMQAIARLKIGTRVVGLVPASENMPDAAAYKPGDILTAMNGKTIEVRNTDAEGRLILADALAYATSKMRPRPKAIVDLATLTGACLVALGDQNAAIISNNEPLAERLLGASGSSGDALWRLPISDGYRKQIDSPYADIANLGSPGAGTVTAAAFLEHFVGKVPWAHLDIAGMAWTSKTAGTLSKGATGFGVRVMSRFLKTWHKG